MSSWQLRKVTLTYLQVRLDGDISRAVGDEESQALVLDKRGRRPDVLLLHGENGAVPVRTEQLHAVTLHKRREVLYPHNSTDKLSLYFHTTHGSFIAFLKKRSNYTMETTRIELTFNRSIAFVHW